MKHTLGGWQRLWIVLACVYLVPVAVFTWSNWPTVASISHEFTIYSQLPPQDRASILNSLIKSQNERAFIQDARSISDVELVDMPNGHILVFRKSLPRPEAEASARAYWGVVENMAFQHRLAYFARAIAWWSIPLAIIYLFGLAVRWIRRGFKGEAA